MSRFDYTNYRCVFPMGLMRHLSHPKPPHQLQIIHMPPAKTANDAIDQIRLDVEFAESQSRPDAEAAVMTSINALKLLLLEITTLRDRCEKLEARGLKPAKFAKGHAQGPYVLISHGEAGDPSSICIYKTTEERDRATIDAIEREMDAGDAEKYLSEARSTQWIRFEGDPPLEWTTLDDLVAKRLVAVAKAAHRLMDNAETSGPVKRHVTTVDGADVVELSATLDELDELPELPELIIATGPAKAEYWLGLGLDP